MFLFFRIESNGKMFYTSPPYSANNMYAGQDMNNDYMH
jgi:hypothetical protein